MTKNLHSFLRAQSIKAFLTLICVLISSLAFAAIPIKGVVKDSNGEPLLGVTVTVPEDATVGAVTDLDGAFTLNVPDNAKTIQFSYMGYETQDVGFNPSRTQYDIVMQSSDLQLDEVVVIGYGVQSRKDLTGSVSSVNSETLMAMPVSSPAEAIAGRMAGVTVSTAEGGPDAEIKIRVRGGGSVTQDNSPLYIVDGFPVTSINDIAPSDIQSIDVLKDASSTAIYGSRGANGVIIVTTKSGKEGKVQVSFNGYVGWKKMVNPLEVQDSYQYVMAQYELANYKGSERNNDSSFMKYYGEFGDLEIYKDLESTNWQEEIFGETGFTQSYNASFMGGSKSVKYSVGLTHVDDESIMIFSGFSRDNISLRLNGDIIPKKLTFDVTSRLSNTVVDGAGASTEGGSSVARLKHAIRYMPTNGLSDMIADGDDYLEEMLSSNAAAFLNPYDMTYDEYKQITKRQQTYNGALNWTIIDGLTFRTEWGVDFYNENQDKFYGLSTSTARNNNLAPVAIIYTAESSRWREANTLTYQKEFGDHNITALLGQEYNSYSKNSTTLESRYFPTYTSRETALANMDLGTAQPIETYITPTDKLLSYFGRLNYSFKGHYLLTATLRADGSSKFAAGNRWGYFPSVAGAWRISDEPFMESSGDWLSNLKLRASYGAAGNNRVPDMAYTYTYTTSTPSKPYGINGEEMTIMTPSSYLPNEELKWETTITRNVGLDYGFFNNRISGVVDLYWNTTKDLLIAASIPSSSGFGTQYQNIGRTSNKGIEFTIDAVIVDNKNFGLDFSFNAAYNQNRVEALGEAQSMSVASGWNSNITDDFYVEVGKPIGQVYGYVTDGMYEIDDFNFVDGEWVLKDGIGDCTSVYGGSAIPGSLKLKMDEDGNAVKEILGCTQPELTGGFTLSSRFKNFDFSAYFTYSLGNMVVNANKLEFTSTYDTRKYGNLLSVMDGRFTYIDGDGNPILEDPEALAEANRNATIWTPNNITKAIMMDWALEDGSYMRLSTLTMGYTLPSQYSKKIGMSSLRFYVTGTNLWLLTNYSGSDPEVDTRRSSPLTPGVDYSAFPRARQVIVGANIKF